MAACCNCLECFPVLSCSGSSFLPSQVLAVHSKKRRPELSCLKLAVIHCTFHFLVNVSECEWFCLKRGVAPSFVRPGSVNTSIGTSRSQPKQESTCLLPSQSCTLPSLVSSSPRRVPLFPLFPLSILVVPRLAALLFFLRYAESVVKPVSFRLICFTLILSRLHLSCCRVFVSLRLSSVVSDCKVFFVVCLVSAFALARCLANTTLCTSSYPRTYVSLLSA